MDESDVPYIPATGTVAPDAVTYRANDGTDTPATIVRRASPAVVDLSFADGSAMVRVHHIDPALGQVDGWF
jgi:hypothetical protein